MRVAFIGGSVTVGDSPTELGGTSWRPNICRYLADSYPNVKFDWVHAGIGGTDSTYGVYRFDELGTSYTYSMCRRESTGVILYGLLKST